MTNSAPNLYMVRANFARYAPAFRSGGYVGIGWLDDIDLSFVPSREALRDIYEQRFPAAAGMSAAQSVGQVWRFLTDLSVGSYVVTPLGDNSKLLVGRITSAYFYQPNPFDSPYPHRKSVDWFEETISRSSLSVPVQNTLRSSLTIFQIGAAEEILALYKVPLPDRIEKVIHTEAEINQAVLDQILQLTPDEFEILVKELLTAVGFEAEHVGQPGDGGIDVTGKLRVYEFAAIDIMVQVKQYKAGTIDHKVIESFRAKVPERSHAAFVTTSDFTKKARLEAEKDGFKKIGLINGSQLVDILVAHYDDLPQEVRDKLRLRKTLIPQ